MQEAVAALLPRRRGGILAIWLSYLRCLRGRVAQVEQTRIAIAIAITIAVAVAIAISPIARLIYKLQHSTHPILSHNP